MGNLNILQNINLDRGNYNRIEGHLMVGSKVKVKVKLTLEQATKTQRRTAGVALLFL
jgi:hypothetical protein